MSARSLSSFRSVRTVLPYTADELEPEPVHPVWASRHGAAAVALEPDRHASRQQHISIRLTMIKFAKSFPGKIPAVMEGHDPVANRAV